MTVNKIREDTKLTVSVEGRLDTMTAPQLEQELEQCLDGVKTLVFDFGALKYLSSAGLRVILGAQKTMNKQGKMTVRNANQDVMDVFELTGFVDILTIE